MQQCQLLGVARSRFYYKAEHKDDAYLANSIAEIYRQYPFYGYRRITACLRREGYIVNHKCVLRIMRRMGLKAIYPGPKTTIPGLCKHPYALEGVVIDHVHQVWQIDITYLRTEHGFIYLNALIDVYSRYVVAWTLSNSLDQENCIRTLDKAFYDHPKPEIINSDQGSQFTSQQWVNLLEDNGIKVSMSGRGKSNDNAHIERLWRTLKYESCILNGARSVSDYKKLLPEFISWYNHHRPHQSLRYKTLIEVLADNLRSDNMLAEKIDVANDSLSLLSFLS